MTPKKSHDIIRQTAEELNLPEHQVSDLVHFFYKELRLTLSNLKGLKIDCPGLGHFIIRQERVKRSIDFINKQLQEKSFDSFKEYQYKKNLEDKLEKLTNIQAKIKDFLEEKQKFRDEQAKYYLEKQKANNGGN
jgi:nucleoid DNA-binding protein